MWRYLEKDFTRAGISTTVNLHQTPDANPSGAEAAWLVTVGLITNSHYQGGNLTEMTRTGKVTKIVYKRNGYCVTIENGNATVERYE